MKKAFTLAEVLITLGVIGVVAALTVPALIVKHQKQVTVTRLKETYSILNQAVISSQNDNGPIEYWDIPNATGFNADTYNYGKIFAKTYLLPYLKIIKECQYKSEDCRAKDAYRLDGSINSYSGALTNHTYNFVLSNGVVLGIWPRGDFVETYIDVNGKDKPNTSGKDIFNILLVKTSFKNAFGNFQRAGVYFYGQGYDRDYLKTKVYPCAKSGSLSGLYCGALIMLDGWKIAPDYPW